MFDKPLVHIIDREADSVGHLRQWDQVGCHWLVRVKGNTPLTHQDQAHTRQTLAPTLAFEYVREVKPQGQAGGSGSLKRPFG